MNFSDRRPDWTIWVHDIVRRKKPVKLNDLVKCIDEHGNSCGGFVQRIDSRTNLMLVALDRRTYESVKHA